MDKKLLEIIDFYGIKNQLKKFNEESYELIEAIIDYKTPFSTKEHIAEEIADVTVMLLQFKEYYGIDGNDVLKIMNEKIDRQLKRMEEE